MRNSKECKYEQNDFSCFQECNKAKQVKIPATEKFSSFNQRYKNHGNKEKSIVVWFM